MPKSVLNVASVLSYQRSQPSDCFQHSAPRCHSALSAGFAIDQVSAHRWWHDGLVSTAGSPGMYQSPASFTRMCPFITLEAQTASPRVAQPSCDSGDLHALGHRKLQLLMSTLSFEKLRHPQLSC